MCLFLGWVGIAKRARREGFGQHYADNFGGGLKIDVFVVSRSNHLTGFVCVYSSWEACIFLFKCIVSESKANKLVLLQQSDLNLQKLSYTMLSLHSRHDQLFLIVYRQANFPSLDCCSIPRPLQFQTAKTSQQPNQQKRSLKAQHKRAKQHPSGTSIVELSATLPRKLKRKAQDARLSNSNHTMPHLRINRVQSQEISLNSPAVNPTNKYIPNPFISQQSKASFPHLIFTYSEPRLQIYQQTNTELAYVKEIQNIEQTTCLEFQSQESVSHYFGNPARIIRPPIIKRHSSDEEQKPQRQGEYWSDQSMISETKPLFQQIDEQESLCDSHSVHLKNKVTVDHNHSPTFEQFRKTYSIINSVNDSSSHLSGHSIVIENQHNFLTPHKHRYFYNNI